MKLSAVVPVYNNETTIDHVIHVLKKHPDIEEIIVIDDASKDRSRDILSQIPGINLVFHKKNMGKGRGVTEGWQLAKNEMILAIDADLAQITKNHIDQMVSAYVSGSWDMVIGVHSADILFRWLSGQRIYKKSVVLPYASFAKNVGNGIEQVINHAHKNKRVFLVDLPHIGHILKYQRHVPYIALWLYCKEGWQLLKTEFLLRLGIRI